MATAPSQVALLATGFVAGGAAVYLWWSQSQHSSSFTSTASDPPTSGGSKDGGSIAVVRGGDTIAILEAELKQLVRACLITVGATSDNADAVADVLVAADMRGVPSHGVNRLEMYIAEIENGVVDPVAKPSIAVDGTTTAHVCGNNALGAVVSTFCTDLAIAKAKAHGTAMVVCNHSNHFGIAGFYSMRAMEQGLLGMAFTNTSPFVVPTRALPGDFQSGGGTSLGTNAISCAIQGQGDDSFVLDMASSAVAVGKVEVCHRKGTAIPTGWGLDKDGEESTDPSDILPHKGGALLPLGGTESTSGYKGFGLGMFIEILCGVLPAAATGPEVQPWKAQRATPINYGHCFIVVDPSKFQRGGETTTVASRLQRYMDQMRNLPVSATAPGPVLVPGDPERSFTAQSKASGIEVSVKIAAAVKGLAIRLGVPLPKVLAELEMEAPKHYAT